MFRSSTIIRELALNLAKVIFMLKNSVELRRYLLCMHLLIMHDVQNATLSYSAQHATHTPFHEMLPHNRIINKDVVSPNVLT